MLDLKLVQLSLFKVISGITKLYFIRLSFVSIQCHEHISISPSTSCITGPHPNIPHRFYKKALLVRGKKTVEYDVCSPRLNWACCIFQGRWLVSPLFSKLVNSNQKLKQVLQWRYKIFKKRYSQEMMKFYKLFLITLTVAIDFKWYWHEYLAFLHYKKTSSCTLYEGHSFWSHQNNDQKMLSILGRLFSLMSSDS